MAIEVRVWLPREVTSGKVDNIGTVNVSKYATEIATIFDTKGWTATSGVGYWQSSHEGIVVVCVIVQDAQWMQHFDAFYARIVELRHELGQDAILTTVAQCAVTVVDAAYYAAT